MIETRKPRKGKPQPSLKFVNLLHNIILDDIWGLLETGLWCEYLFDINLKNETSKLPTECHKPVFQHYMPIYPGFAWDKEKQRMEAVKYVPKVINATRSTFDEAAEKLFRSFGGKKLGIHLSGGLDSSLIIGLLHHFGIPFVAIGLKSSRFEFRTERLIQEILLTFAEDGELIDLDEYPFYSGLNKIEKHQVPQANIKMNEANKALADAFALRGVQIVFTGQGGDSLFVDAPSQVKAFNIGDEFTFPWEQDFYYGPQGMELHSFYANKEIIDQIYNLRRGYANNPLKSWARSFFTDLLPRELSQFTYRGDFFGHAMSGLEDAKPMIKLLFEESFDLTHHHLFSLSSTKEMIDTNVFDFDHDSYIEFCTRISMSVWLHSLFRIDDEKQ